MRGSIASRRAHPGVLAALCVLATAAGSTALVAAHSSTGVWSSLSPAAPATPYRLGTAAQPFAWSTAVGDLNADGRPDFAVADRIGRFAAGFQYSLELLVSGRPPQSISFDSPEAALAVSLRDVDHDHDLDLVVSTVLSPSVVRVWLNDSHGSFEEAPARAGEADWSAGSVPSAGDGQSGGIDAESTSRRADEILSPVQAGPIALTRLRLLTSLASSKPALSARVLLPPRAPPPPASRLL